MSTAGIHSPTSVSLPRSRWSSESNSASPTSNPSKTWAPSCGASKLCAENDPPPMLFNSYEFVFFFLPITVIAFYLLGSRSKSLAIGWLILASLAFYAWWRPLNVALIAPSILVNYGLARLLLRWGNEQRTRAARALLIGGIAFNVLFLGYFKY